jgi:8-amino-7-oxononanoate synthase
MRRRDRDAARKTADRVRDALASPANAERGVNRPRQAGPASSEFDFSTLPEFELLKITRAAGDIVGIDNPFYRLHDRRASATTSIAGRQVANFSSYDYLGLNGHPEVIAAAKAAVDRYGTSASASRITAGERPVHRDLEAALARHHGVEDAALFVSGHATNVSVIGGLLGPQDLIVTDALIHNSVTEGIKLSGAKRVLCPHGDMEAMERALRLNRARHRRALIVVEGLYSMDGDLPDLAALIKMKRRYNAWLMVDEAHSTGVIGRTGRGIAEEQNVDPTEVDIWMGTLSKTLSAAGGYIAGTRALVDLIKYTSPAIVYSVGLSPPLAAASLTALQVMRKEGWRLAKLRDNGQLFLKGARARGLDTGLSIGAAVIPVIVGNSPHTVFLSERLLARGYNIFPIIFPGVAENQARLRFFITSEHAPAQIEGVLDAMAEELPKVRSGPSFVSLLAKS